MVKFLPGESNPYSYAVLAAAIIAGLPRFGRAVLAFLRDLHDYRAKRHER